MVSNEDPSEVTNWVKEKVLGTGGFGTVTLWRHKNGDKLIAVKKCRFGTDSLLTPKQKERWKKEVEIMMRLNHPNVVTVFPVPEDIAQLHSDLPMLCMEYCNKGDLRQVLNRAENACGLQERDVRELVKDITSAIKYLHSQRITHRDLKPENIVLASQDNGSVLYKLIDLGYAKELDQTSICTSFVGTLQYLAPELFTTESVPSVNGVPEQFERRYTSSVDYWSLGLVTHEAITGVRPFLPNMAPGAWMKHVMKKSPDHICAYQTSTGVIEFSSHLFLQNHISSTLRQEIEQWLKLALEWDSKKRGRNQNNEIVIFSSMEKVLEKKIIKVFSVTMYQWFSYAYDLKTTVRQVQEWIEADTALPVKDQELFMEGRKAIDYSKTLAQSVTGINEDTMYVLHRFKFELPTVLPSLPPMVVDILQSPYDQLEYNYQKRQYANAVFFLNQENSLYKQFLTAFKLKLLSVVQRCQRLVRASQQVTEKLTAAAAQRELSSKAYKFDSMQLKESPRLSAVSAELTDTWKKQMEMTDRKLNSLQESSAVLTSQTQAANKRIHDLHSSPMSLAKEDAALKKLEDDGLRLLEALRRRPTAEKSKTKNSLDMVKVIYACLKQRDIVLRSQDMATHFRNMVEGDAEVQRVVPLVEATIEKLEAIKTEIVENFQNRQKMVWHFVNSRDVLPYSPTANPKSLSTSLFHSESTHGFQHSQSVQNLAESSGSPTPTFTSSHTSLAQVGSTPSPLPFKSAFNLSSSQEPIAGSYCTSVLDSGIAGSAGCSAPKSQNGVAECRSPGEELTESIIYENTSLRVTTQELMMQSYNRYLKLINDEKSMDWSFLNP